MEFLGNVSKRRRDSAGICGVCFWFLPFIYSPSPFLLPGTRTQCLGLEQPSCDHEVECHTRGRGEPQFKWGWALEDIYQPRDFMFTRKTKHSAVRSCQLGFCQDSEFFTQRGKGVQVRNKRTLQQERPSRLPQPVASHPRRTWLPTLSREPSRDVDGAASSRGPPPGTSSPQKSHFTLGQPTPSSTETWAMWATAIFQLGRKRGFQASSFSLNH